MLEVRSLTAHYGAVPAVRDADLELAPGELVSLVGANGAGKTTLLRSIMGQHDDRIGRIVVDGIDVSRSTAVGAARAGIAIVPQGRRLFASLSVEEHFGVASSRRRGGPITVADVLEFFPGLAPRRSVRAQALSGGEQQMLAIARAVLLGPTYVLMDEPTEGLAPLVVESVARLIEHLPSVGIGVLVSDLGDGELAAQATRSYVMDRGAVTPDAAAGASAAHVHDFQKGAVR